MWCVACVCVVHVCVCAVCESCRSLRVIGWLQYCLGFCDLKFEMTPTLPTPHTHTHTHTHTHNKLNLWVCESGKTEGGGGVGGGPSHTCRGWDSARVGSRDIHGAARSVTHKQLSSIPFALYTLRN